MKSLRGLLILGIACLGFCTLCSEVFVHTASLRNIRPRQSPVIRSATSESSEQGEAKIVWNYFKNNYDLVYVKEATLAERFGEVVAQVRDLSPWSEAEKEALRVWEEDRPNWREAFLGPKTDTEFRRSFRAVAEVSGGEEQAVEIIKRNLAVLLFKETQIRSAGAALVKGLGEAKAREVMVKNPGVLTIDASNLQEAPRVRFVAIVADIIDVILSNTGFFGPLATVLQTAVAVSIGKATLDVVFLSFLNMPPPWS
mmetsp:Transcript_40889/g.73905  ORF Transcript_40889/g.73905 Transcript_40889/m.73905 type:complete len:255 (+) Transcript_40889:78-842(+)